MQNEWTDVKETEYVICTSCQGAGTYDMGDCEEGLWGNCEECGGYGFITEEE